MKNKNAIGIIVLLLISISILGCIGSNRQKDIPTETVTPTITQTAETIPTIAQIDQNQTRDQNRRQNDTVVSTAVKIITNTSYLGVDKNTNTLKYRTTINTNEIGNLTYLENYYSIDGDGKPKFYSSKKYFDGAIKENKIVLDIYRPPDMKGEYYSIIEEIFVVNGQRTNIWVDLHKYW